MDVRRSSVGGSNLNTVQEIVLSCDSSDEDDVQNQQTTSKNPTSGNRNQLSNAAEKSVSRKAALALRKLTANQDMKFMDNFDPESSNREKRKLTQKSNQGKKAGNAYDEKGILISSGKDLCDCLEEDCPGCHFPCPKCRSLKCGLECRQNRKYTYDFVEAEGTNTVIRNRYK